LSLSNHLYQYRSGFVLVSDFSQKSHAAAMNSIAGLEPEVESEAVDGRHGSLSGGFPRKPAGDQK
jgi:hypothetical protein